MAQFSIRWNFQGALVRGGLVRLEAPAQLGGCLLGGGRVPVGERNERNVG
ncbi:hypothetical protein ACWC9U_39720 [Streptomyces sp. 900116325]